MKRISSLREWEAIPWGGGPFLLFKVFVCQMTINQKCIMTSQRNRQIGSFILTRSQTLCWMKNDSTKIFSLHKHIQCFSSVETFHNLPYIRLKSYWSMAEVLTTSTKSLVQTNILHSPHLPTPLVQCLVLPHHHVVRSEKYHNDILKWNHSPNLERVHWGIVLGLNLSFF